MKKILSVILILAALFGLVAGYMDLTDMLDCKSYWETKGAESDANLDALEAGLTTLKDNKQAYEDGLVTLAEGEKTYEEGKASYEAGLATYTAGVEEYDAGVLAYNAGMEQLAAGRGKVIDAKDKLSTYTEKQKTDAKAAMTVPEYKAAGEAMNAVTNGSTDKAVVAAAAPAGAMAYVATKNGLTVEQVQALYTASAQAGGKYQAAVAAAGGTAEQQTAAAKADAVYAGVNTAAPQMGTPYSAYLLDSGLNAYDKGYYDYMVAKGTLAWSEKKLAAAKEQLDAAKLELDAGKKTLDEAEKQLDEGRTSIKTYEDGVAQVKAGLAQVVATPADGGLVSIADRLGEGFKYTDGDELLLDKGFEALAAAREYSADNGALVTKEIASRAVGCILVLLAAVAGIVAGIVNIMKGTKLGGLLAIVACAAALIGVVVSYLAGSTFSAVAGSAGSTLLWIAGAAVAVMGLAAGLVGLTAKTPAKAE